MGLGCDYATKFRGATSHDVIVRVIAFVASSVHVLHGALGEGVRVNQACLAYAGLVRNLPSIIWRCVVKLPTFCCGVHMGPLLLAMPYARIRFCLRWGCANVHGFCMCDMLVLIL